MSPAKTEVRRKRNQHMIISSCACNLFGCNRTCLTVQRKQRYLEYCTMYNTGIELTLHGVGEARPVGA